MRRREFIALIGGATAWPLAAQAQPAAVPTIGFLGPASAEDWRSWTSVFVDRLAELGWSDGSTVRIVFRWADGHGDRFDELAAELVKLNVKIIVTAGSATLQTKKRRLKSPSFSRWQANPSRQGWWRAWPGQVAM
jgi:putative ABC transport system substrate-binding protein